MGTVLFLLIYLVVLIIMMYTIRNELTQTLWRVVFSLLIVVGITYVLKFSITTFTVKALTLFLILFYASTNDILHREVPDFVSVMILILAVSDISVTSLGNMVLGFLAVFVPQIAIAMLFPKKAIGGADIKISSCSAFLLGVEKGVLALIIGLAIAVIVMTVMSKLKRRDKNEPFPLMPFLAVGILSAYLI